VVRQAGGGTAFGEVNLEAGDSQGSIDAAADEMELGGRAREGVAPGPGLGPAVALRAPAPVAPRAESLPPPPQRKSLRLILVAVVVLVLGGGMLALVPSVGPFGVLWAWDKLNSGEHQKLLASTTKGVHEALAKDTHSEAKVAYQKAEAARAKAKRLRSLAAYVAYVAYARELRFGADPEVAARARVLLDELKDEKERDIPYLDLARAAHDAAAGQVSRARPALEALAKSRPNDIDVLALRGELELKQKDAAAAAAAWDRAEAIERSARTAYGSSRAKLLAGDRKGAEERAREALTRNPAHVGARIMIARITWNRGQEAAATQLLEEATKADTASPGELVEAYSLLGDVHLARSRVSHAERAYSEALKIDPKASRALVGLGDALYKSGRFSEALARFEAASQADATDLVAKVGVVKASLGLERIQDATSAIGVLRESNPKNVLVAYWFAKVQEAVGNRKDAESVYRGALAAGTGDPDLGLIYIGLAQLLNTLGRNEDAQQVLSEARQKLPDSASIRIALGDISIGQGKVNDAITEYKQALELDPGDVGAKFKLAVAYRRNKQLDQASQTFDEVASVDKEYPGLALERGLLYELSGRTAEALKAYEDALAKAPEDTDLMLRVGCGKVSVSEAQAKDAEELLKKVLGKRPGSAEANFCLGRARLLIGTNLAEALKTLQRAAEMDPNRAEYHLYVGWAANEAARPSQAEASLQKAIELDAGLGDAYWQRGILRYRQGRVKDAVKDLQKALELKPSRVEAHAALADSYYDLGKEAEAMREWKLALEAQPENPTWRFRYGKLLAANHQEAEARANLAKALELGDKTEPKPKWLWDAHQLYARTLGASKEAIPHWEEFLRSGPIDSPYRKEAKKMLAELGKPWDGP
jgi:tetratricopeptide (TPR) repeat protein